MNTIEPRQIFQAGETIFLEGEPGNCAYIIEKGRIDLFIVVDGKPVQISSINKGNLLGEMALLDDHFRTATAVATEPTELIVISRNYFSEKLKSADEFMLMLLNVMLERYGEMRARVENILSQQAIDQDKILIEQNSQDNKEFNVAQVQLENNLRNAFEQKHLELFYQPIISLVENKVVGCEALIRWRDPEKGLIPPDQFIGLSEETGLIIPIGLWIIEQACLDYKQFNQPETPLDFISINVSGRQFAESDLVENIEDIFQELQVNPQNIKFEITESILMSNPLVMINTLNELKKIGSQIALDDFGTGYSSFSYLHRFPIDSLKIDRSFTSTMQSNEKSFAIVKSLCTLANALNISVIAEGVELDWEKQQLIDFNADYGQGYFFAKPMPADEFSEFIQNWQV